MACCGSEEAQGEFPPLRGLAGLDRRSPKPSRLAKEESGMSNVVCNGNLPEHSNCHKSHAAISQGENDSRVLQ